MLNIFWSFTRAAAEAVAHRRAQRSYEEAVAQRARCAANFERHERLFDAAPTHYKCGPWRWQIVRNGSIRPRVRVKQSGVDK